MEKTKPVKPKKDTPVNHLKTYFRNAHYLINKKTDVLIGPKFVFTSLRVPQIKNY